MKQLIFNGNKRSAKRLSRVQKTIDCFSKSHSGNLSKHDHKKLRRLLNKRVKALSKATGMKVHSLFD